MYLLNLELVWCCVNNQKIILRESRWRELFKGTARQISIDQFGDKNVNYIIADNDIYTPDYLKIEVEKE